MTGPLPADYAADLFLLDDDDDDDDDVFGTLMYYIYVMERFISDEKYKYLKIKEQATKWLHINDELSDSVWLRDNTNALKKLAKLDETLMVEQTKRQLAKNMSSFIFKSRVGASLKNILYELCEVVDEPDVLSDEFKEDLFNTLVPKCYNECHNQIMNFTENIIWNMKNRRFKSNLDFSLNIPQRKRSHSV